jgi:hypothetical protein
MADLPVRRESGAGIPRDRRLKAGSRPGLAPLLNRHTVPPPGCFNPTGRGVDTCELRKWETPEGRHPPGDMEGRRTCSQPEAT